MPVMTLEVLLFHPVALAVRVLVPMPTTCGVKDVPALPAGIVAVAGAWITAGFSLDRLTVSAWTISWFGLEYFDGPE